MSASNSPPQLPIRDREEAELRNWMLPLKHQEFRVPDASRIGLPEDIVEWSGRLFLLTRWFRRVALWLTCLAVGIVLVSWAWWFISSTQVFTD